MAILESREVQTLQTLSSMAMVLAVVTDDKGGHGRERESKELPNEPCSGPSRLRKNYAVATFGFEDGIGMKYHHTGFCVDLSLPGSSTEASVRF